MPARLRAVLIALFMVLALSSTGVASANPSYGFIKNNDDVNAVYYNYTYVGKTYNAWVYPGGVSYAGHDVNAFHVGTCYKITVRWYHYERGYSTYTYTGPYWANVGPYYDAYILDKWKYC